MSATSFLLLAAAGVAGGLTGSVAGLASLATYPALLAVGLPPVTANVTNTVALVANGVGSALGSKPELRGTGRRLRILCPAAALGGATGAALLLLTPAGGFERVVPWLLGLGSLAILLPRRQAPPPGPGAHGRRPAVVAGGLFLVAIYGGYFGAAAGVLMLALLLAADADSLPRANAIKSVVLSVANGVAAAAFAFVAPVRWSAVLPLAVGCLVGSRLGPSVVRRAPVRVIRVGIAVAGLALAVHLGLDADG